MVSENEYVFWRKDQTKAIECNNFGGYLWVTLLTASLNCVSRKARLDGAMGFGVCCACSRCCRPWVCKNMYRNIVRYHSKPDTEPIGKWSFLCVLKPSLPPPPHLLLVCSALISYVTFSRFQSFLRWVGGAASAVFGAPSTVGGTVGSN